MTVTHLWALTPPSSSHQSSLIHYYLIFLPTIQIVGVFQHWACVCVYVCACCRLNKMERAQSIKRLTVEDLPLKNNLLRLSSLFQTKEAEEGGSWVWRRVPGGVLLLPNEAVCHSACWQKARVSHPPASTPKCHSFVNSQPHLSEHAKWLSSFSPDITFCDGRNLLPRTLLFTHFHSAYILM